ncbi:MAG TPA: Ig-like domain-containing protein, partial [Blastocatellia bacterium]|nr:Ig-like domain-containing protein [Blastocatellia bacterium]
MRTTPQITRTLFVALCLFAAFGSISLISGQTFLDNTSHPAPTKPEQQQAPQRRVSLAAPLDPSGDPDTAFDTDGKVEENFSLSSNYAEARGVGIQSSGKIVIGGFSYNGADRYFALLRLKTDGRQDFDFGDPSSNELGTTKVNIGGGTSNINDIAIYPASTGANADKIVGAGFSNNVATNNDFAVARFTKDGLLDQTFGPNSQGYIEIDFNNSVDRAAAVAVQDDGKVVVVGFNTDASSQRQIAIVRLTSSGQLDTTFNGDGKLNVDFTDLSATADDRGTAVAIRGTGTGRKIVVGGWTKVSGVSRMLLIQLDNSGNLDTGFGDSGKRVFANSSVGSPSGGAEIRGLTLDSSGRIVACGYHLPGNNINALTVRFTAPGTGYPALDTSYDSDGWAVTALTSVDTADRVQIDSNGKIVTFGFTRSTASNDDLLFIRRNTNGSLDTTFSTDGVATVNVSDFDNGFSLAIDSSNRPVGVGRRIDALSNGYIVAARLTNTGAVDNTFGPDVSPANGQQDGFFITQLLGGSADNVFGVAQLNGKTVLAGYTWGGTSYDMAVMRFDSTTGALDTTFAGNGKFSVGDTAQEDIANAVAIQSDNKVVAVGVQGGTPQKFTLWRLTNTGTLDSSFDGDGIAQTTLGTNTNSLFAVAIYPSTSPNAGKILVGGSWSNASTSSDYALLRFNTNGSLDTSFDTDGKVTLNIGTFDQIKAIAIQPDDKIVVGGSSTSGSNSLFSIARFNSNGSLDTTFNTPTGYLTTRMSDAAAPLAGDEIRGIAVMSDSKIVAGGKALNNVAADATYPATQTNQFALLRVTSSGTLDNTFGTGGKVVRNLVAGTRNMDEINGIALQFDDKIVAFGSSMQVAVGITPLALNPGDLAVARFNWDDGSFDTTYSDGSGFIVTDITGHDRGGGGVVYSDGKTLGAASIGGEDFGAAKFLGDPTPTTPTVAPDLDSLSDTGRFNNDNITRDNTPTFTGSCVTGETMLLKVNGADTTPRSRALCRNSQYSVTTAVTLADGTYSFTVVSTNSAGASAASPALSGVVIDTVVAAPTIILPAAGSTVAASSPVTISGSGAETVADVKVYEAGNLIGSDPDFADVSGGAWSLSQTLSICSHTITARQTDLAGNTSGDSATRQFYVKGATTTALTQNSTTTVFGEQATFTATVTSASGTVTGTARFTVDAEAPVDVTLSSGQASINRSNLSVGSHTVTVSYLVTDCFEASTGTPNPLSHTVIKADTTTVIAS